jgi:hypothetical protein
MVFACTDHHIMLNDTCPACGHTPRRYLDAAAGLHPPATCPGSTATRGSFCGADLRAVGVSRLEADEPLLTTQRWINTTITTAQASTIASQPATTGHRQTRTGGQPEETTEP